MSKPKGHRTFKPGSAKTLIDTQNQETIEKLAEEGQDAPGKNKVGRPKRVIDYDAVERLASIMCTQEEIASHLDISVRTLLRDEKFCQIYRKGLDKGKMSFRRQQYKTAETGNTIMQIWLGKQYLGQRDNPDDKAFREEDLRLKQERIDIEKKRNDVLEGGEGVIVIKGSDLLED